MAAGIKLGKSGRVVTSRSREVSIALLRLMQRAIPKEELVAALTVAVVVRAVVFLAAVTTITAALAVIAVAI